MANGKSTLDHMKAKMSPEQQTDMAELLASELRSRKQASPSAVKGSRINTTVSDSQVGGIYADVDKKINSRRVEDINQRLSKLRKNRRGSGQSWLMGLSSAMDSVSARGTFLFFGVLLFAVGKILLSSGVVSAAVDSSDSSTSAPAAVTAEDQTSTDKQADKESSLEVVSSRGIERFQPGNWSEVEKQLLTQLDSRRVELEKRRATLDDRETQLKAKETALSTRLAELRSLTRKLSNKRKEQNHRYEARLEQLANVYGSMAPKEAAPLVAQLNDEIALALLERMPGKRMGQILSMMRQERAVGLTLMLTQKGSVK